MSPKYLRMIRGMKKTKRARRNWSVYILRCADDSLYTGITNNVEARIAKHQKGKGAAYTRTHLPVQLVYQQHGLNRSQALIREAQIKRLPRSKKEKMLLGNKTSMFIAIYRWKLKKGKEDQFRKAWSEVTLALRQHYGSFGSRLHRAEDGTWVAYAQWPSKESWQEPHPLKGEARSARKLMRDAAEESLPDLYMTVSDDYLIHQ